MQQPVDTLAPALSCPALPFSPTLREFRAAVLNVHIYLQKNMVLLPWPLPLLLNALPGERLRGAGAIHDDREALPLIDDLCAPRHDIDCLNACHDGLQNNHIAGRSW